MSKLSDVCHYQTISIGSNNIGIEKFSFMNMFDDLDKHLKKFCLENTH